MTSAVERAFAELDDLILYLKGLVLVRRLREQHGADTTELEMYGAEIERVRDRLATMLRTRAAEQAAA